MKHLSILPLASVACLWLTSGTPLATANDSGLYTEPFAPARMPFKVTASIRSGYDSNLNTASGEKVRDPAGNVIFEDKIYDSFFTGGGVDISRTFGGPRTSYDVGLNLGANYYFDAPQRDEWDYQIGLYTRMAHSVSPRMRLSANVDAAYQSEPKYDDASSLTRPGRNGQYFYGNAGLSASYQWTPKFSTVTSARVSGVYYERSSIGQFDDRLNLTIGQAFRYLIRPTTSLVAEYRYGSEIYSNGQSRDYQSHYILGGVDHTISPRLSTSWRAGTQIIEDVAGVGSRPYLDGSINYQYGPLSTVRAFANYGFNGSGRVFSSSDNMALRSGISVIHGFSPKLSGNLGFYYQWRDNDQGEFSVDEYIYTISSGVTYNISRNWFVSGQYSFTLSDSDNSFRDYDRHLTSLSLGTTF